MSGFARCLAPLALLLGISAAQAHAQLDRADPRVGSVVRVAPTACVLYFTESIEAAFSSVQVTDAGGQRVDSGKPHIDAANPRQVRVSMRPLPAGVYTVRWRVLSADTHTTQGSFSFEVRP